MGVGIRESGQSQSLRSAKSSIFHTKCRCGKAVSLNAVISLFLLIIEGNKCVNIERSTAIFVSFRADIKDATQVPTCDDNIPVDEGSPQKFKSAAEGNSAQQKPKYKRPEFLRLVQLKSLLHGHQIYY